MCALAVLHPGAMGAAVAACLVGRGHEVGWLRTGRSEAALRRAEKAGLTPYDDLAELLAHADIVFSICPPHGALGVARALAGFGGIVVDANAISPETAVLIGRTVTGGGARYVDGGIIGPAPFTAGTTRLYLAGDDGEVANLFAGSALDAVSLTGAVQAGVGVCEDDVRSMDQDHRSVVGLDPRIRLPPTESTPTWRANGRSASPISAEAWLRARQQSQEKGWRWSYELAEVGRTFAAVGQPEGFGAAASEVFAASSSDDLPGVGGH